MHITIHAAERFLQRVLRWTHYTKEQIDNAKYLLGRDLHNLQRLNKTRVVLPSFPNYHAVFVDNTVVTIIPKK